MPKARPPESLDRLRAMLDAAAVARALIPLDVPAYQPAEIAAALHVPLGSVAAPLVVDADGDRLLAIVPGDARLDLRLLAAALGARQARLAGHGMPRGDDPVPMPAVVSGLPTVIDRSLIRHQYIFGSTDDPSWVVRVAPAALRKVTGAMVADIVRTSSAPRSVAADDN